MKILKKNKFYFIINEQNKFCQKKEKEIKN